MSLSRFFEKIAPTLLGETPADQSAATLGVDPRRLGIYERFCRVHRYEAIEGVYPQCESAVAPVIWSKLVEDFFRRFPMRDVELNANAERWPEYLASQVARRGLPAWLSELADLEWWEWQTMIAPDEPADPREGPLRLASTLEIRPYRFQLLEWFENGPAAGPLEEANYILFWRDPELSLRREVASPLELVVLKSIATGEPLTPALLQQLEVSQDEVDETLEDLREAGILVGR